MSEVLPTQQGGESSEQGGRDHGVEAGGARPAEAQAVLGAPFLAISDVLSVEACAWLISELRAEPGVPTRVGLESDLRERVVDEDFALSWTSYGSPGAHWVVKRALGAVEVPGDSTPLARIEKMFDRPLELAEELHFLSYDTGGFIRPHIDGADGRDAPERIAERVAVFSLFLNDREVPRGATFAGGEFVMHPGAGTPQERVLTVEPQAGALVVFPADLAHSVNVVTRGKRYAVTGWWRSV